MHMERGIIEKKILIIYWKNAPQGLIKEKMKKMEATEMKIIIKKKQKNKNICIVYDDETLNLQEKHF